MTTVFVAGSIAIKNLNQGFKDRLANIVQSRFDVVVGDADGADSSIQRALFDLCADKVTVYCVGMTPRNNIGGWPIQSVSSDAQPGTRAFFTAKDLKMASIADYGLMIWDKKSTGTLSNILEMLKLGRKSVVFINKDKRFINICNTSDMNDLVETMSESARYRAESKIRLSGKINELESHQFGLV